MKESDCDNLNYMNKGKFIVIEGGEGSGKSSLINDLKSILADKENLIFTKEPGGTSLGEELKKIILSETHGKIDPSSYLFLFSASRAELLYRVIKPALDSGKNVICDRFILSTYAYQIHAMGRENLIPILECINNSMLAGYLPDLNIYLDVEPSVGIKRIMDDKTRTNLSIFDKASEDFHKKVREGYLKYVNIVSEKDKSLIIETTNLTTKEVLDKVVTVLKDLGIK